MLSMPAFEKHLDISEVIWDAHKNPEIVILQVLLSSSRNPWHNKQAKAKAPISGSTSTARIVIGTMYVLKK